MMLPLFVALVGLQSSISLSLYPGGAATAVQSGEMTSVHFVLVNERGKEVANTIRRGLPMTVLAGDSGDALLGARIVGLRPGSATTIQLSADEIQTMKLSRLVGPGSASLRILVVETGAPAPARSSG